MALTVIITGTTDIEQGGTTTLTATVRDDDNNVILSGLEYAWSATQGAFDGSTTGSSAIYEANFTEMDDTDVIVTCAVTLPADDTPDLSVSSLTAMTEIGITGQLMNMHITDSDAVAAATNSIIVAEGATGTIETGSDLDITTDIHIYRIRWDNRNGIARLIINNNESGSLNAYFSGNTAQSVYLIFGDGTYVEVDNAQQYDLGGVGYARWDLTDTDAVTRLNAWDGTENLLIGVADAGSIGFPEETGSDDITLTATATAVTTPDAATDLSVTVSSTELTLVWTAPVNNGGSVITDVEVSTDNTNWTELGASATSHTFTGLTNSQLYTLYVRYENAEGYSPTASAMGTPLAPSTNIIDMANLPAASYNDVLIPVAIEDPDNPGEPKAYKTPRSGLQSIVRRNAAQAYALIQSLLDYDDLQNVPTTFGLTEAQVNALIAAYGEPFTTTLLNKLNGIAAGAQVNRTAAATYTLIQNLLDYDDLLNQPTIPMLRDAAATYALIQSLLDYDDLLNQPTIPTLRTGAATADLLEALTGNNRLLYSALRSTPTTITTAQSTKLAGVATRAEVNVNADWDATTGDAEVLNKPTSFGLTEAQVNTLIAAYGEPFTTALLNQLNALPTSFAPTNAEQNVLANWNSNSGDSQILNKPTVPTSFAPTNAEQNVKSNWDSTSGDSEILNKPTIPTVPSSYAPTNAERNVNADWDATSGDAEIENKPTIPSSYAPTNAEQNVQSNWNATSGDARILNKPTTITTAQSAKLTGIDADADMTDVANVLLSLQATNAGQKESARVALEVAKVRFVFNENGTYSLPSGNNSPTGITYISSIDEVWVVDFTDGIYRLSTSGASLGTYSLPTGNNDPRGITYISSIDEVWVIDFIDDIIYRLSTSGASLGTYSLPTGNNSPNGITYISSIDEVWVVDSIDDIIYRLSTSGASLGTYSLPTGNNNPGGITYISSINEVWVVDITDGIYRLSTSGASLGTYSLPTGNNNPGGITYISSINEVWVVDNVDDIIYRIQITTVVGSIELYRTSTFDTTITITMDTDITQVIGLATAEDGSGSWSNASTSNVVTITTGFGGNKEVIGIGIRG